MFDQYMELLESRGPKWFYVITLGGGALLLLFSFWIWWHFTYLNPQNTFWAAFSNNLITTSVSKQISSQDNSGKLEETEQLSLGAHNLVRASSTITQSAQNTGQNSSKVTAETLGTPTANYNRYVKIETDQKNSAGQALDFGNVVNVWSKQDLNGGGNGAFADAMFDAVPFAHLNGSQRKQVIDQAKRDKTYDIDFSKVGKVYKNGRLYYTYDVALAPDKYVSLLKLVDNLSGLNQLKNLDPAQYQGSQPVSIQLSVDAQAHQLAGVTYTGNSREEQYSSWGGRFDTNIPTSTVSQTSLQSKLNTVLNGQ